jgi:ribosomal protein L37AE/L43A
MREIMDQELAEALANLEKANSALERIFNLSEGKSNSYTQHPCVYCKEDTLVWSNTVSDWSCESCGKWEEGESK